MKIKKSDILDMRNKIINLYKDYISYNNYDYKDIMIFTSWDLTHSKNPIDNIIVLEKEIDLYINYVKSYIQELDKDLSLSRELNFKELTFYEQSLLLDKQFTEFEKVNSFLKKNIKKIYRARTGNDIISFLDAFATVITPDIILERNINIQINNTFILFNIITRKGFNIFKDIIEKIDKEYKKISNLPSILGTLLLTQDNRMLELSGYTVRYNFLEEKAYTIYTTREVILNK